MPKSNPNFEKPWAIHGITRRHYAAARPWKKAGTTKEKYAEMLDLIPHECIKNVLIFATFNKEEQRS